ncbi:MAG: hypothetical protein LDL31_04705 [Prosthecobacter sp.]|nr:hypothetical protein [Prosthecobacter sp.]
MNWDQGTWDSGSWDQPSDYFTPPKHTNKCNTMKRQVYFPSRIGDQVMDERPLLVAGAPEVREYRMRFWDKGTPNGDWTDVVKVTVSP